MRSLGLFCRILVWLSVLSFGMVLLVISCWFSQEPTRDQLVGNMVEKLYLLLTSPIYLRVLPGLILTVVAILAAWPAISTPAQRSVMAFSLPDGSVEISKEAVRDFVARLCSSAPGVREVKEVRVMERQDGASIVVRMTLGQGSQVPETTTRCREQIKQELNATLGIEKVSRVTINIDGVEPSAIPIAPPGLSEPKPPPPAASPFSMPDDRENSDDEFKP